MCRERTQSVSYAGTVNLYMIEERVFLVHTHWVMCSFKECQKAFKKSRGNIMPSKACIKKIGEDMGDDRKPYDSAWPSKDVQ